MADIRGNKQTQYDPDPEDKWEDFSLQIVLKSVYWSHWDMSKTGAFTTAVQECLLKQQEFFIIVFSGIRFPKYSKSTTLFI